MLKVKKLLPILVLALLTALAFAITYALWWLSQNTPELFSWATILLAAGGLAVVLLRRLLAGRVKRHSPRDQGPA